jgi:hypothetical protein
MCFAVVNGFSFGKQELKEIKDKLEEVQKGISDLEKKQGDMQEDIIKIQDRPGDPIPPIGGWNDKFLKPITWEDVVEFKNDLDKLYFYVSRDLTLIPKEQNSSRRGVSDNGRIVTNDKNNPSGKGPVISNRTGVKMVNFASNPRDKESIEIFFSDQFALLKFVRNAKNNFFELEAVTISTKAYTFDNERSIPLLCIYDETSNDNRIPPPGTFVPPNNRNAPSETRRPVISGNMPVMAKIGQSNYLDRSAVVEYMLNNSHGRRRVDIEAIVDHYFREARTEGINHDIAIAQMWRATQSLTNETLWNNCNYAGLSTNGASWDRIFRSRYRSRDGVRAHIQHLKGYASKVSLKEKEVDPRFRLLTTLRLRGSVDTLHELCRPWVGSNPVKAKEYEEGLIETLKDLYDFQERYNQRGLAAVR